MHRKRASDVMSSPVLSVSEDTSVRELAHALHQHRVSGIPVTDTNGLLVGIVTEGDLVAKEAGPGGLPMLAYLVRPPSDATWARADIERLAARRVGDLMTRVVITATEETPVHNVAAMMNRFGIKRVPIVRDGMLVGIVSRADIVALFDRPDAEILEDARRAIADDLLLDPGRFHLSVADGVLYIRGQADVPDAHLLRSFLCQVDGVVEVDTSELLAAAAGSP